MTQPVVELSDSDVDEIVEDTFTIAGVEGDADAVLAHLRTRLLDLSLTNRLLQFRHGTRSVRVIDEVPDQVFARLRNGDELELVPVPEPTLDRPGGAKRGNADIVSPNGPPQPRGTVRQVREATARAHAKELGLSTDFDLTPVAPAAPPVGRRPGKCIQTPLFPADLESSLRAIASEARSAIEEKGSNVLYLVFGFLEWFEADASDKPVLSPLLMLPVVLRRGDPDRKTGAYRFFISYSGEDILPNISLQERLRRDFGIDLPDMEDDESPETYARRIQDTVPLLARWTLRRQVSLGLLLFTKLLMYKDLDPTSWPAGSAPTKHPRLLDLFQGGGGGRDEFAREYHFDADDHAASAIPPIIMDADSSQHSAIVDVIAGRSMVIEGPPGTGKSQTIANLIAAAMGEGKTVLFIADKLTALEVVRKRLDGAGLGLFCLELHSDKTQKAWLMEDLRRRLDRRNTFSPPAALDAQLSMVNEARHALNIYAKSVNAPFGRLGWTIYDILWGTQRRRSRLGGLADRWSTTILRDAEKLDLSRYEEMCRVAEAFTSSVSNVRSFGELHRHPFWGMWPEALTPDTEAQTSRALVALHDGVVNADARIAAAESELGAPMPRTLADMQSWSSVAQMLVAKAEGALLDVGARLARDEDRDSVAAWCSALERHRAEVARLPAALGHASTQQAFRAVPPHLAARLTPKTPLQTVSALDRVHEIVDRLDRARSLCDRLAVVLADDSLPRTLPALQMASDVMEWAIRTPFESLPFRPNADESVSPVLDAAAAIAEQLRAERSELAADFDLSALPDPVSLEAYAATCATAGFFSFLSGRYRAATRQYVLLAQATRKFTASEMATGYKALSGWRKRVNTFEARPDLKAILGVGFQGIDTNFAAIRAIQQWQAEIRSLQRRHRGVTQRVAGLATADRDILRDIAALGEELRAIQGAELPSLVHSLLSLYVGEPNVANASLADVATELLEMAKTTASVSTAMASIPSGSVRTVGELLALIQVAKNLWARQAEFDAPSAATMILGPWFRGTQTATPTVRATIAYAEALFAATTPAPHRAFLGAHPSDEGIKRIVDLLNACCLGIAAVHTAEAAFVRTAGILAEHWYGRAHAVPAFAEIVVRTTRAHDERSALPAWLAYLRARVAVSRVGLDAIREAIEGGDLRDLTMVGDLVQLIVYQSLARAVFESSPSLRDHDGLTHTAIRERFRRHDAECIRLQSDALASRIDARPVPDGVSHGTVKNRTELALLRHELSKQKRHLPIRQLVNRAGGALRGLKPCFMMSPRSVAQYLEPGRHVFDIVVMDEASQLRPEDAVGAIARAKQVVVVGDSKQLPPTSFFEAAADGDDDAEEEFITENKESILDLAKTAYRPARQLRWHYRSRDGSLIAFSNARYYDRSLIVFPGPREKSEELGVRFVHVDDASYAAGQNLREAERVTEAVIEHLRTRPDETFGVVALNVRQKVLLEGLIHDRLKNEPELRSRFDRAGTGDAAFIKNLESVQGDERDVIFISVTYGPSSPGAKVARRFGPLNGVNGARRLNVLFTRARLRVVVFASFTPEQLGVDGLSQGAEDLRDYLAFARSGRYQESSVTSRDPDSDFEVEVAEALRAAGYGVTPQVGVDGYFIDMGVRSPRRPGEYVLGVECDGAAYHSSFSARDRDRLRQNVLEGLGWKLHRVWSTDWFRDPRTQTQRLLDAVRSAEASTNA